MPSLLVARYLKAGHVFSLNSRKNAKRLIVSITADQPLWIITKQHPNAGKLLIILDNCQQLTIEPEQKVYYYGPKHD